MRKDSVLSPLLLTQNTLHFWHLWSSNVCVFPHNKQSVWHQLSVLQLHSILTLFTWSQCQISRVKGSVQQDCPHPTWDAVVSRRSPGWLPTTSVWLNCKSRAFMIPSEKTMATHSSTLAWRIPWVEEPGGLPSMGSQRVRHDWATSLSHFTFMHWRRKRQPTPVFLPGESQGWRSLMGCLLWGHRESDTTDAI